MKVTKYPQSCLLIEQDGTRILIDPGNHFREAGFSPKSLEPIDAVLYTHQHGDHYDRQICDYFLESNIPIYANRATGQLIGECNVVADGEVFHVNNIIVTAKELPHCETPAGPGPQNTGYLIDGVFFHPGDGKELDGLVVDGLALPISGPDISVLDAIRFIHQVGAKTVIPIHYDGLKLNPLQVADYIDKYAGAHPEFKKPTYMVLANAQEVEL